MATQPFSESEYAEESFTSLQCGKVELKYKEFYDCTFVDCSFNEASFRDCKFDGCLFRGCDLSLVDVTNSAFIEATFEKCQCIGINWTVADWSRLGIVEPLGFQECAISHSIFMGLELKKCVFRRCIAEDVDFTEADLTEADCTHTNFLSARFNQTNLTKANFDDALNYQIDIRHNTTKEARFSLPEAISLLRGLDIVLSD